MFVYTSITSDQEEFEISALLDESGNYVMPSLSIFVDSILEELIDNPEYLLNTIIPYLKGVVENDELDDKLSSFKDELLEMFDKASELGFFKNI